MPIRDNITAEFNETFKGKMIEIINNLCKKIKAEEMSMLYIQYHLPTKTNSNVTWK